MMTTSHPDPIKVVVASDLHLEFANLRPELDEAPDLVLLAGDIGKGTDAILWSEYHFPDTPVAVISGNHESYWDDLELMLADCRAAAGRTANVRFLENDETKISVRGRSVRILGAALWTDFALHGAERHEASMLIAQRALADYRLIGYKGRRLVPSDTVAFHKQAIVWLESTLPEPHDGPTVVLTHHSPSRRSIPPFYRDSLLSPAFNSDLEHLILKHQPELWIHGHTHWSTDYELGRTRIYSNQRGYPSEEAGFRMQCITL